MANQDFYNVDAIISEALRSGIDISPIDRQEWVLFCCALKILGYDESTFVALSNGNPRDSRQVWRNEKHPGKYIATEDKAKAKVIALAKAARMDLKPFVLSQYREGARGYQQRPNRATPRKPEAVKPQRPEPHPNPFYISNEMLDQGQARVKETGFYKFLCSRFDTTQVDEVLTRYRVGASNYTDTQGNKAVSFPMINRQGLCIDSKIFHINPETGSRKDAPPLLPGNRHNPNGLTSTFALAMMKDPDNPGARLKDRRGVWAYFGEHLLQDPTKPVAVVEAEKTAIIAALVYPGFIWIATGSISNLNPERFEPLRGYKVTIFPDRDGLTKWREKAQALANQGFNISIDTTITRYPGSPKDDLADIILRCRLGTQEKPQDSPKPQHGANYQPEEENPAEATAEAPTGETWGKFKPWRWCEPEPGEKHGEAWLNWLVARTAWRGEQISECVKCKSAVLQDGVYFRKCTKKISQEEAASERVCRGFEARE